MLIDLLIKKGDKPDSGSPDCADRPWRSLLKALSWRVTGSLDTILLAWLFTSDVSVAAAIGLTEVLTKTVLYYLPRAGLEQDLPGAGDRRSERSKFHGEFSANRTSPGAGICRRRRRIANRPSEDSSGLDCVVPCSRAALR